MSYLYIPRSWYIANALWIYAKFSWPLHCMTCFMSQTYLNQTFKNQELASMDGKPNSTFISLSGLVFPASLPSFWPRFLLQAYLPGLSTNIIPALTQIHCLYLFQLNSVFCFGLIYETWCVTKATLVKSQVGQAGIARSQSDIWLPWLSARHLGGPSRISFHGLKYPTCCPQWVLRQKAGADVGHKGAQEEQIGWSVYLAWVAVNTQSKRNGWYWNEYAGKREGTKEM